MRKTVNVDADLLAKAREMSNAKTDIEAINLALRHIISHTASQELRQFGASEPYANDASRPSSGSNSDDERPPKPTPK